MCPSCHNFNPVYDADRRTQDPLVGNRAMPGTNADFTLPAAGGGVGVRGDEIPGARNLSSRHPHLVQPRRLARQLAREATLGVVPAQRHVDLAGLPSALVSDRAQPGFHWLAADVSTPTPLTRISNPPRLANQ